MASSLIPDQDQDEGVADPGHHTDPENAFINRVAAKYVKEDKARADAEDGVGGEEEEAEEAEPKKVAAKDKPAAAKKVAAEEDADTEGAEEHAESDTSTENPDGEPAESEEDSEEGEESDQPETEVEESEEDAEAEEEAESEESEEEEGGEVSDELVDAAARHSVPLTLDDIKDETARKVVKQKFADMDAGFTRVLQEARAYRTEQAEFRAEKKFATENPDLVVVELLRAGMKKDPQFVDNVQARLDKLEDGEAAEVFESLVGKRREDAKKAVTSEMGDLDQRVERSVAIEKQAKTAAASLGLPWRFAERAVVAAIKSADHPLTDAEVKAAIKAEYTEYDKDLRAMKRTASVDRVKGNTERRAAAPPAKRAPASSSSPRPGPPKKEKYDDDNEESRHKHMMATAKRLKPGAK